MRNRDLNVWYFLPVACFLCRCTESLIILSFQLALWVEWSQSCLLLRFHWALSVRLDFRLPQGVLFTSSFYTCQYIVHSIIPYSNSTSNHGLKCLALYTEFSLLYNAQAQFDMRYNGNDIPKILCCNIKSAHDVVSPTFETSYQKRLIIKGKGCVLTKRMYHRFDAILTTQFLTLTSLQVHSGCWSYKCNLFMQIWRFFPTAL